MPGRRLETGVTICHYQVKKDFTTAAFKAIKEVLGTSDDRMFLTITEYNNWGGFGDFRDEYYSEIEH